MCFSRSHNEYALVFWSLRVKHFQEKGFRCITLVYVESGNILNILIRMKIMSDVNLCLVWIYYLADMLGIC